MRKKTAKKNHKMTMKKNTPSVRFRHLSTPEGFGDCSPIAYQTHSDARYFDFQLGSNLISTANISGTMLGSLLSSTGILATFPANATPVSSGGAFQLYRKIRLKNMLVALTAIGSQSNTLASGDIFNRLRVLIVWSGETYQGSQISPLSNNSVDQWPNLQDVEEVLGDWQFALPSQAFNTSNYNSPAIKTWRSSIPINRTLECFSTTANGTGAWDNKHGDLVYAAVSDSSVSPNPILLTTVRVYYEIVD
jgi:hypothetical protein